jgi:transcriptional regulator with XRE-family HTH domain
MTRVLCIQLSRAECSLVRIVDFFANSLIFVQYLSDNYRLLRYNWCMKKATTLGEYVLEMLSRHPDLSMRSASMKAGLNPNAVHQIASGERPHPRHDTLKAIADTLGTEHDYYEMCQLAGYPTPVPLGVNNREEVKLLTLFRALPEEEQEQLLQTITSLHGGGGRDILSIALRAGDLDNRGRRTILEMIEYVQKAQKEEEER